MSQKDRVSNRQAVHACNICIWDLTESPLKSAPFNQIYNNKLQAVQVFPVQLLPLQYLAPQQLQTISRQGELQTLNKRELCFYCQCNDGIEHRMLVNCPGQTLGKT